MAQAEWVPDYFRLKKTGIRALLEDCVPTGYLARVEVSGWPHPAYLHPDTLDLAIAASRGRLRPRVTTFLSPFDPVVWDRARAHQLFDFHYRIEVYTPGERRKFGYFSMPILYKDALIGRLDAKAHRKEGRFEVRALHLEEGVALTLDLVAALTSTIQACADWHGTPRVVITRPEQLHLAQAISA